MIVEQKFDNCENHGLQHAWKVFEINNWRECSAEMLNSCSPPIETPVREDPIPFIRKEMTRIRRCQNCTRGELFETESVGKWVRK